ncbi:MAG: class II fructose-bisphosphate aldolase [Anaerolineae bacterium]|nr:class II fructose-bisphosphate aldolase [Anaerolineae bacterium]
MRTVKEIMENARQARVVIPAFNIPYLPMVRPVVEAVAAQNAFALLEVARLEWTKFEAKSMAAVFEEFSRWSQPEYVRLHLDHIPVIDEDNQRVDYLALIREAIALGYPSVMVDGSRLSLADNIAATRQVVDEAHPAGVVVEAELGAILGHEAGPLPPYEELFVSGRGFTDVEECARFVVESGCDSLSVAVGSIHGAVSGVLKDQPKVEARLNLEHLERLHQAAGIPLVLHGGSGIKRDDVLAAVQRGITKVNVGTEIRQAYEAVLRQTQDVAAAQQAVYERTTWLLHDYFVLTGSRDLINPSKNL